MGDSAIIARALAVGPIPEPELRPVADSDTLWELCEDYALDFAPVGLVIIRAGYRTDGQSVPRFAWPIIGHPFYGRSVPAAIGHDFAMQSHHRAPGQSDRQAVRAANEAFRRALIRGGVSACKARVEWAAVSLAGMHVWRSYPPDLIERVRGQGRVIPDSA